MEILKQQNELKKFTEEYEIVNNPINMMADIMKNKYLIIMT